METVKLPPTMSLLGLAVNQVLAGVIVTMCLSSFRRGVWDVHMIVVTGRIENFRVCFPYTPQLHFQNFLIQVLCNQSATLIFQRFTVFNSVILWGGRRPRPRAGDDRSKFSFKMEIKEFERRCGLLQRIFSEMITQCLHLAFSFTS